MTELHTFNLSNVDAMKQPDLGKKLSELRKARGLTQEELVERCNVSVRTIQRIETGEVMPRSYTVRTIVAALDYSFEDIFLETNAPAAGTGDSKSSSQAADAVHGYTSLHGTSVHGSTSADGSTSVHEGTSASNDRASGMTGTAGYRSTKQSIGGDPVSPLHVARKLSLALGFGLFYFLLTFPEALAEYSRFSEGTVIFGNNLYITLKIALGISFLFFQLGFIEIGKIYDNYLLRIAAITHVVITAGLCVYDVVSLGETGDRIFFLYGAAIVYGSVGLLYGAALLRLRKALGRTALIAGGLEIVSAVLFLTVVLTPLADVVGMFAELVELVVVYKVIDMMKIQSWRLRASDVG